VCFVGAISRYCESSTYARKSDGSGSSRYVAKVWCATHQRRARTSRDGCVIAIPRRNRHFAIGFGGLQPRLSPPKLCWPRALDRVSACIEVAYLAPIGATAFCRGLSSPAGSYRAFGTKKCATSKTASVPGVLAHQTDCETWAPGLVSRHG
jgi:hypothetical protein